MKDQIREAMIIDRATYAEFQGTLLSCDVHVEHENERPGDWVTVPKM